MFVFDLIYKIILRLPLWRHSVHLYCRAWQSEHGGGFDFSLQGTGTCFVTFYCIFHIIFFFGVDMYFYNMTKYYFVLLAHVLLVTQLSVQLVKV